MPVPFARCPYQENLAQAAGAAAVVHRFDSPDISPQWWDFSEATIPVLFTDVDAADGMVAAGIGTVRAHEPTWGFLRVFDAAAGVQVSQFDDVPNINDPTKAGNGFWSIAYLNRPVGVPAGATTGDHGAG